MLVLGLALRTINVGLGLGAQGPGLGLRTNGLFWSWDSRPWP